MGVSFSDNWHHLLVWLWLSIGPCSVSSHQLVTLHLDTALHVSPCLTSPDHRAYNTTTRTAHLHTPPKPSLRPWTHQMTRDAACGLKKSPQAAFSSKQSTLF
jgi:hypothetical protein